MKRKILLTIMALCLVFSTIFMVSSCAMFARRVSVTYDKERGIVEGEGKYKKGKQVTLTATAYDGYVFQGWYDISTLLSTENTYVFKMGKKPVNLNANFAVDTTKRDLTILYKFNNGTTASETHVSKLAYGESYDIPSPVLVGYECDIAVVSGTMEYEDTITVTYTPKTYTLKVNSYLGNTLMQNHLTKEIKYNENYSVDLPQIDYYLPPSNNINGKIISTNELVANQLNNSEIEIKVPYSPKKYNLVINCINGNNILETAFDGQISYKENYSVVMPPIEHYYTLTNKLEGIINTENQAVASQLDGNKIVLNVEYTAKPILTINYKYANGNTAKDTYTQEYNYNADYSVTSPEIIGFNSDKTVVSGKIIQDTKIDVIYTEITYNYTIKYVNESNNEINTEKTGTIKYGDTFNFSAETITNYVPIVQNISGTINENNEIFGQAILDKNINLTYTFEYLSLVRNIKVNYVDTAGKTIKPSTTVNYNVGETYTVNSAIITGYTANQTQLTGTVPAEKGFELTFTYTINSHLLTVKYLDSTSSEVLGSHTKTLNYNENYKYTAPNYDGYTCRNNQVNVTMGDAPKTIEVLYDRISYNLVINYLNDKNASIATKHTSKVAYKNTYSVTTPTVTGYIIPEGKSVISGTMGIGDVTINVVYTRKVSKLTINYISSVSGFSAIKPNSYTANLKYEDSYSVTSPVLFGLTADKAVISGTMGATDLTFDVTYTNSNVTVTIVINNDGEKLTQEVKTLSFTNQELTNNFANPYIVGGLGYKVEYDSVKLSLANNKLTATGISGSNQTSISTNIASDKKSATITLNATDIISTLTVKHRVDNSLILDADTQTYTKQYGEKITIGYNTYEGYVPNTSQATKEYTFNGNNETYFFDYTSKVLRLTIYYINDIGRNVAQTYTQTYNYNESYSVTSPIIDDYIADKLVVSGKMGINNITVIVSYKVDWETDPNTGELLIRNSGEHTLQVFSEKSNLWDRNIRFEENLDLNDDIISPIGTYAIPFKGEVNGNGKTISNFVINSAEIRENTAGKYAYVGLFGCATEKITNLTIENAKIDLDYSSQNVNVIAGLLVGQYTGTNISNVNVSGTIEVMANSVSVGGIVGTNMSSEIINSTATVEIIGSTSDITYLGGIVGENYSGTINGCNAKIIIVNFNCSHTAGYTAGYIAGYNSKDGIIINCSKVDGSTVTVEVGLNHFINT